MPSSYHVSPRRSTANEANRKAVIRLILTIVGIVVVLGLFYFWFFIATANINNFWGLFRPRDTESTTSGVLNSAPATPTLTDVPEATNKKTFSFKGYAEPGTVVTLFVQEIQKAQTLVDKDGNFSFSDVPLDTGSAVIYVKTKNSKGQDSPPSKSYTVIFDDKAPVLNVKNPQDGDKFTDASPFYTVEGTVNETGIVLVNDHQASLDSGNNFRLVISLKEGDNFLTIKATDKAGNTSQVDRKLIYQKP